MLLVFVYYYFVYINNCIILYIKLFIVLYSVLFYFLFFNIVRITIIPYTVNERQQTVKKNKSKHEKTILPISIVNVILILAIKKISEV